MKRISLFLLIAVAIFSCKKDKKEEPTTPTTVYVSTEEGKKNVENAATGMISEMEALKNEKGVKAVKPMADVMSTSDPLGITKKRSKSTSFSNVFMPVIQAINMMGQGKITTRELAQVLKNPRQVAQSELEQQFDSLKGVYTWNNVDSSWTEVLGGSVIEINFPGSKDDMTTNNAKFTFSSLTTEQVTIDGEIIDVPTSVYFDLKVDNETVISYNFTSSFKDNRPTSITSTLALINFSVNINLTNNNQAASFTYNLKKGTQILMEYFVSANGNWSEANIEANTTTIEEFDPYNTWDSVAVDKILYTGKMHVIILGIKVTGNVNVASMYKEMADLEKRQFENDLQSTTAEVGIINKNVAMSVQNYPSGSVIANMQAYVKEGSEMTYNWVWNPNTLEYEEVMQEVTIYEPDVRMVFGDGSKSDMETYFKNGFSTLETDLNKFITDLNNEFETSVEPITFSK